MRVSGPTLADIGWIVSYWCVCGLLVAYVIWFICLGGDDATTRAIGTDLSFVYGTIATVVGSLLGFSIAATALLISMERRESVAPILETVGYKEVKRVFVKASRWLAYATVSGIVSVVLENDKGVGAVQGLPYLVFVAGNVFAVYWVARMVWALEKVMRLPGGG